MSVTKNNKDGYFASQKQENFVSCHSLSKKKLNTQTFLITLHK